MDIIKLAQLHVQLVHHLVLHVVYYQITVLHAIQIELSLVMYVPVTVALFKIHLVFVKYVNIPAARVLMLVQLAHLAL